MKELLQVSQMAGKNFPDDILLNLLSRVPVKTLLRFRLMSKYWYARLSSPEFIKLHTRSLAKDENHMQHKICFLADEKEDDLRNCSLPNLLSNYGFIMETIRMDYPICTGVPVQFLVGSANGLICSSDGGVGDEAIGNVITYSVWNPAIRKLKELPPLEHDVLNCHLESLEIYPRHGFGFDEKNGDYKLVVFLPRRVHADIRIYSMKSDSWRKLEGFPDSYVDKYPGTCLNGKLYWLSFSSDKDYPNPLRHYLDGICSLDLADETWGKLELPTGENWTLGILSGELCVLSIQVREVLLWTRKDEVEASWMCMCRVNEVYDFEHERYELRPPFFKSNAGKIFLSMKSGFVVLNPDDKTCRQHNINAVTLGVEIYCESLVNPLLIAANQDLDSSPRHARSQARTSPVASRSSRSPIRRPISERSRSISPRWGRAPATRRGRSSSRSPTPSPRKATPLEFKESCS